MPENRVTDDSPTARFDSRRAFGLNFRGATEQDPSRLVKSHFPRTDSRLAGFFY
jgi:hypothetical protein